MIDATFNKINKIVPTKWQWVLNHEGFRRYFKNTGWMFFGQFFSIISVLVGIWVARYLGPENFGNFSFVLAFVGMFSFISNLGINNILTRDLVSYPEKRDKLMGTAFVLNLVGGCLAFFATIAFSFLSNQSILVKSLIAVWSTSFIFSAFSLPGYFFQASVQAKKNTIVQIIVIIISSLLKVALILLNKGIIWLVFVYVFDYILGGALYFYNYKKCNLKISAWTFDKEISKNFLSVSWLLMLSSVASSLLMKIDQVMIGLYLNSVAVGLYAAAVKLVEIWYFVPVLICSSLFPAIINAKKDNIKKYSSRLNNLYYLLFAISLLIAIPLSIVAPWLILKFYGASYFGAIEILRIYIWSGVGLFLTFGINQYLLAENKFKFLFFLNFISMLINVILNFILIPKVGLIGAAWATLISYSVGPLVFFIVKRIKPKLF